MSFSQDFNIKVGENSRRPDLTMPRFYIQYGRQNTGAANRSAAYAIISRLKGQSDLLLEVNSELLNLPPADRGAAGASFLEIVERLGLDFRHRKRVIPKNARIFGVQISLGNHTTEEHDILAYLPDVVWQREDLYSCLPLYGARYYVLARERATALSETSGLNASTLDASSILDQLWQGELDIQAQLRVFQLIAFDCLNFGQMGISSSSLTLQDLKRILEI